MAPASFDIKDFDRKILLALISLGEAKGSKILELNKFDKLFQEIYNHLIPKGSPAEGSW